VLVTAAKESPPPGVTLRMASRRDTKHKVKADTAPGLAYLAWAGGRELAGAVLYTRTEGLLGWDSGMKKQGPLARLPFSSSLCLHSSQNTASPRDQGPSCGQCGL
jgi:hypothetical protein